MTLIFCLSNHINRIPLAVFLLEEKGILYKIFFLQRLVVTCGRVNSADFSTPTTIPTGEASGRVGSCQGFEAFLGEVSLTTNVPCVPVGPL